MSGQVLMTLGTIRFSISDGAYQQLRKRLEIRVAKLERAGAQTARQPLGFDETIDIEGVVFAAYKGGIGRVESFRTVARQMQPQTLTDGLGKVWGKWLIESVEEDASVFTAEGVPLRQAFRISLGRYGG